MGTQTTMAKKPDSSIYRKFQCCMLFILVIMLLPYFMPACMSPTSLEDVVKSKIHGLSEDEYEIRHVFIETCKLDLLDKPDAKNALSILSLDLGTSVSTDPDSMGCHVVIMTWCGLAFLTRLWLQGQFLTLNLQSQKLLVLISTSSTPLPLRLQLRKYGPRSYGLALTGIITTPTHTRATIGAFHFHRLVGVGSACTLLDHFLKYYTKKFNSRLTNYQRRLRRMSRVHSGLHNLTASVPWHAGIWIHTSPRSKRRMTHSNWHKCGTKAT